MLPSLEKPCVTVFEDNQGAVELAQIPVTNSNSKHMDVRHHFLREIILQRDTSISHMLSAYQHVDGLTKDLGTEPFQVHCNYLMNLG